MCGINLRAWRDESCELCQSLFGHHQFENNAEIDGVSPASCDQNLIRRGPDAQGKISITHPNYHRIECAASVLKMRAELLEQPVPFLPGWINFKENTTDQTEHSDEHHQQNEDEKKAYLCWNGEIYQQLSPSSTALSSDQSTDVVETDEAFMYDVADTTIIKEHLESPSISIENNCVDNASDSDPERCSCSSSSSASPLQHHIANAMARLYNAEFAFCVLTQNGIYYGRDFWGRRSLLLWRCPRNCGSFQLVSVAENLTFSLSSSGSFSTTPTTASTSGVPPAKVTPTFAQEWIEVPPGAVHSILFSESNDQIAEVFYPKASFSLPRLPKDFPIPPKPNQNVIRSQIQSPLTMISDRLWTASLELEFYLRRAVTMRVDLTSPRRSTGVLFSGGVDSVVLAALAADVLSSQFREEKLAAKLELRSQSDSESANLLPTKKLTVPILYLYNVSFGPNPEKSNDRKAALKSYGTLREKYQTISSEHDNQAKIHDTDCKSLNDINHRDEFDDESHDIKIVFRDIVVEWEDICRTESHIRTLLSPKHTVMDINIATALWFASRGTATENVTNANGEEDFSGNSTNHNGDDRSPRVLLLGMGADELMGGYGRHRKAYERGGWNELQKELTMDQNRLWERNCGRDDRLCSDHGREARFPFLDAHVVRFLQEGMASEDGLVCDFNLPPGVGDKRILRLVAERLGLEHACGLVKRAIQFGSRISHLSDTKRFGSRRKAKGATNI